MATGLPARWALGEVPMSAAPTPMPLPDPQGAHDGIVATCAFDPAAVAVQLEQENDRLDRWLRALAEVRVIGQEMLKLEVSV